MNAKIFTIYVPNKVQTNNQVSGDLAQTQRGMNGRQVRWQQGHGLSARWRQTHR